MKKACYRNRIFVLFVFMLSGCTQLNTEQTSTSLYSEHPWVESAALWVNPHTSREQLAAYTKIEIAPIEFDRITSDYSGVTEQDLKLIQSFFPYLVELEMEKRFDSHFVYSADVYNANVPEANKAISSLNIQITFLDASRSAPPLKVSDFIPLRMIYNLGKVTYDQVQGNEVTRFTASIRINAFDSKTQRLVFSVEDKLEGQPMTWSGSSRDFTDIHAVIEQWSKRFADNFQRLNTLGNAT